MKKKSFRWSDESEPHKHRTKAIIKEHPELRTLIGRNPYTFLVITLCVGIQIAGAYLLKDAAWYWIALAAYGVGAFACHTLFVCIHECAHNLIFKNKTANTWAGIFANLPTLLPSSVSFQKYHLKHHSYQGVEALDADMPFRWEAKLINNSTFGKAIWLLFYPIFQALRPFRLKEINLVDGWTAVNWVVQLSFTAAIAYFFGWSAVLYLVLSFFFSVGLHPLGARWVQEHFLTHGEQETKSYYGRLNFPNLNVGFHNEHHDFPSVPWNNLPKVKALAGRHYDDLGHHTSYTRLLFEFLFDRELSVFSRTARSNRGGKIGTPKAKSIDDAEAVVA
ncbi:fatty acid desaturase [Mucilaginibacter terrae]|uniref:Sphingolipid delta-4 desaturase n=1 Tax=Mucilaginibacter terrae TaxID=1955052 RepID=A0ABU3GRM1_9SPHI|nr:fatty acid desaturase [Mucilaginibacter terrae]MDT3402424.1 sphingolipid delta-4 desaturase [Mucilaginibacter terrae]